MKAIAKVSLKISRHGTKGFHPQTFTQLPDCRGESMAGLLSYVTVGYESKQLMT